MGEAVGEDRGMWEGEPENEAGISFRMNKILSLGPYRRLELSVET